MKYNLIHLARPRSYPGEAPHLPPQNTTPKGKSGPKWSGGTSAIIVLAEAPTCAAAYAAQEIQHHFEKLLGDGHFPPVYNEEEMQAKSPGPDQVCIFVGDSQLARSVLCASLLKAKPGNALDVSALTTEDQLIGVAKVLADTRVATAQDADSLIDKLANLAMQQYMILCPDANNLVLWGYDDPEGDLSVTPALSPESRAADGWNYRHFPERSSPDGLKMACRFDNDDLICLPTGSKFSDEEATFEVAIWLSQNPQSQGSIANGDIAYVLCLEEYGRDSAIHLAAWRENGSTPAKYTIWFTVESESFSAIPGGTSRSSNCASVEHVPAGTWVQLRATYMHACANSKVHRQLTLQALWSNGGETVAKPVDSEIPCNAIKDVVTNCRWQWLGIGGRPNAVSLGTRKLLSPTSQKYDQRDWLSRHDLTAVDGGIGQVDMMPRYLEGWIGGLRILRKALPQLTSQEVKTVQVDPCSFLTVSPEDIVMQLDMKEAVGSRYVLDIGHNRRIHAPIPALWDQRGTLDAVYDFLEESLGVRWFAPMEFGETFLKTAATLSNGVDVIPTRRKPFMDFCRVLAMEPDQVYDACNELDENHSLKASSPTVGLALFQKYTSRMVCGHQYAMTRTPITVPTYDQMLWSLRMRLGGTVPAFGEVVKRQDLENQDTRKKYIERAKNHFEVMAKEGWRRSSEKMEDNQGTCVFSVMPTDSDVAEWGFSGVKPVQGRFFFNKANSDYVFKFTQAVAEGTQALLNQNPIQMPAGMNWWIGQHAYASYTGVPCDLKSLSPHIIVRVALGGAREWCWWTGMDRYAYGLLEGWKKLGPGAMTAYLYFSFPRWYAWRDSWNADYRLKLQVRSYLHKDGDDKCRELVVRSLPQSLALTADGGETEALKKLDDLERQYENTSDPIVDFPPFFYSEVGALFARLIDSNMRGMTIENSSFVGGTFQNDQLELYVTLKLAHWAQSASPPTAAEIQSKASELIDEFFSNTGYYGSAGSSMRSYYNLLQGIYTSGPNCAVFDYSEHPFDDERNKKAAGIVRDMFCRLIDSAHSKLVQLQSYVVSAKAVSVTDLERLRIQLFEETIVHDLEACVARMANDASACQ